MTNEMELRELLTAIRIKPGSVTDVTFEGCEGPMIIPPLPGVLRLTVQNCPHFTTLRVQPDMTSLTATGQNFSSMDTQPELVHAYISGCQLTGLPAMPKIKMLRVISAQLFLLPELPSLEKLDLIGCHRISRLHSFPKLNSMRLENCSELCSIDSMPRLKSLYIEDCDKLDKLPELPVLRSLSGYSGSMSFQETGELTLLDYRRQRMWATPMARSRLSILRQERPRSSHIIRSRS